jgi:CRP-like cAMP-binding protein
MTGSIHQLTIFQDLDSLQLTQLEPIFVPNEFRAGDRIFSQGEKAISLYLILAGEVEVHFKPDDGPQLTVARVQTGGIVGWSAALGRPCYTSSVDCATDCQFLRVYRDDLSRLCQQEPELSRLVLERLAIVIAERLRNTHAQVLALLEQGMRALNSEEPWNQDDHQV